MKPTDPIATRRYIQASTGQVHLYDTGGEGVPLVLLHQAPTFALDFAPTFPAFAREGQRLLAVDLPGLGMSDDPPQIPTIMDYRDAVVAVLDALEVPRAHVLGHHTGTKVAIVILPRISGRG